MYDEKFWIQFKDLSGEPIYGAHLGEIIAEGRRREEQRERLEAQRCHCGTWAVGKHCKLPEKALVRGEE